MLGAFSAGDLQSVPGHLLCSALSDADEVDDRKLVAAVGSAFVAARVTAAAGVERRSTQLERWGRLPPQQRKLLETQVADLLSSGWSIRMLDPTVTAHHHVGSWVEPFDLSRCSNFAEPWFTKPAQAFWTCPLPPGRGPVGFESLTGELNPDRSYSSYRLDFSDEDRVFVVDAFDDWERLLDLCGSDSSRTQRVPAYTSLPSGWAGVHVTSRALLRFEARTPATRLR